MIETATTPQVGWPITPHRMRKRRDSKVAYHNNPKHFHRNVSIPSAPVSPPKIATSRSSIQIHQQALPQQQFDGFNFWNFPSSPVKNQHANGQESLQNGQLDASWQPSMAPYEYPGVPLTSPHSLDDNTPSPFAEQAQVFSHHEFSLSYDAPADFKPELEMGFSSDSDYERVGSFQSFDSMDVSNASTMASSISESYVMPGSKNGVDSPGSMSQLEGLSLDAYFHSIPALNSSTDAGTAISSTSPAIPEPFLFDNDYPMTRQWNNADNMSLYHSETSQWSVGTIQPQWERSQFNQSTAEAQLPWNPQSTTFESNADAGIVAFEPSQGAGIGAYLVRQDFIDARQRDITPQTAISPTGDDSEYEGWQNVKIPSYANSSIPSQGSPHSASSPFEIIDTPHQTPSPSHHNDHQHIFTLHPGISKQSPKPLRGRQRALTTKEKQEAREVREAKACWACHLSKIKCSPCSPGTPCKKCAALEGKRRFCLLPCFNDPLESLYTFMVPDYLMIHFTKANVEQFICRNAHGWGSHEMRIRMMWGYKDPIEVVVVGLDIPTNSEIGIHRQTTGDRSHVQKASPPVGIPLAAMDDMQEEYRNLTRNIVQYDLKHYFPVPYDDQDSMFSERLLSSLGNMYCASRNAGNEYEMLRQALEIHVTSTILERSLILDDASMHTVEAYFHTRYPKRSASRCATRQVKLAFFVVQQKRIMKVLESWGSMMWTSNKGLGNDEKWAISFSVLVTLILSIDKTLGLAYHFCEGRIANKGYVAASERRRFQELVRLTQAVLFERCKEIFHTSFKTRKNGKEACNPIRDGLGAFKDRHVAEPIRRFVEELRGISQEFGREIKSHRSIMPDPSGEDQPYIDAGRLACIFLDEFLDH